MFIYFNYYYLKFPVKSGNLILIVSLHFNSKYDRKKNISCQIGTGQGLKMITLLLSSIQQIINLTVMKSELERILKSDLSEYKIAVSEHISNLDHFEQCLTERSAFMQNFNQLLKQQLERYQKEPPTQFDAIQIPSSQRDCKMSSRQSFEFGFSNNNCSVSEILKTQRRVDNVAEICTKFQSDIKQVHKVLRETKSYIANRIEQAKKALIRDMSRSVTFIVQKMRKKYEDKINSLDNALDSLREQNQALKKRQSQTNEKIQKPKAKLRFNSCISELIMSTKQSEQNYSPFEVCKRVNTQNSPLLKTERDFLSNYSHFHGFSSELSGPEPDRNLAEMTLKNNNEVTWKHFLCDIQHTTLKEIKPNQKSKKGKENVITSIGVINNPTCLQIQKDESKLTVNEPSFPILLRKTPNDKTYDIPVIRALVVSYPPVEEGFSILKLGNQIVYRGMWKFRKFHGKGKLCLPQYTYEGDFEQGLFHGRGTLRIGSVEYIGQFFQNKANGEGSLRIGSKNISGRWKNNSMVEKY